MTRYGVMLARRCGDKKDLFDKWAVKRDRGLDYAILRDLTMQYYPPAKKCKLD